MDSGKPFYVINKLSNVIERPETSHRLHMLLRGPSANNSHIYWYDVPDQYGNVRREYKTVPYWQQYVPLHLYHGRRWCVSGWNNGDAGLFTEDDDASDEKYDRLQVPTPEEVKSFLRTLMGTVGQGRIPVNEIKLADGTQN